MLAATPLGQPGDASIRLREALSTAPVIAAEDTRRVRRLCRDLGVTPAGRVVSFFEGNELGAVAGLLDVLRAGERRAAGDRRRDAVVSDPGYRLVAAAAAAGCRSPCVPGPSAVLRRWRSRGLPVDRFCFEGFLPRKAGGAAPRAGGAGGRAAHHGVLRGAAPAGGDAGRRWPRLSAPTGRRGLPRADQDLRGGRRGPLGELVAWADGEVRGEITVVVAGASRSPSSRDPVDLAALVAAAGPASSARRRSRPSPAAGVPKRDLYAAVVSAG